MTTKRSLKETATRDPHCGRPVDPKQAVTLTWEGKTYSFCSEECKAAFQADPPGDAGF
jgi:YHS domain-containing protein